MEEKRVPFDMESYIDLFMRSDQFVKANVWSKVMIPELRTATEHLSFFLRFAEAYGEEMDDHRRPFMIDTWEKAYELWKNAEKSACGGEPLFEEAVLGYHQTEPKAEE